MWEKFIDDTGDQSNDEMINLDKKEKKQSSSTNETDISIRSVSNVENLEILVNEEINLLSGQIDCALNKKKDRFFINFPQSFQRNSKSMCSSPPYTRNMDFEDISLRNSDDDEFFLRKRIIKPTIKMPLNKLPSLW